MVPEFISINFPFAAAGAFGALMRALTVGKGSILLWRKWTHTDKEGNTTTGIDLGILASLFMGATVGVLVDQNPMTAFLFALAGPYLLEEIIKRQANGLPIPGPLSKKIGGGQEDEPPSDSTT